MEIKGLIIKLQSKYRPEELACLMGKSVATLSLWKAGKRQPDKANLDMLTNLAREINNASKSIR